MRKFFYCCVVLLSLAGCATVQVPDYINANHPYTRRFYGSFDKVEASVKDVLAQEGFRVVRETDPAEYERDERDDNTGSRNVLIFTSVKQLPRVVYSKYIHLNIYLRSLADSIEVDIRYAKATSVLMKQFKGTRNDAYVNGLLDRIEDTLNTK